MDYLSLLNRLEKQFNYLQNIGLKYLNIEPIENFNNKEIILGLEKIFKYKKTIPSKKDFSNYSFEENNNKDDINIEKNINGNNFEMGLKEKNYVLFDLYKKYQFCLKCDLGQTRTNLVFGKGSSKSKIMFIGEGPGADEDRTGNPFVGRAGKLLTKMINSIGIERDDVYITNIVKCRPPENRNPTEIEIKSCLPIIKKQIEIINPKLIVTLGNVPAKSLIPNISGITKIHGKVLKYENWEILPTFHPSYLLRNRSSMLLAWQDFKVILELAFKS